MGTKADTETYGYVMIDGIRFPDLALRYDMHEIALWALEYSAIVNVACEQDCLDAFVVRGDDPDLAAHLAERDLIIPDDHDGHA